MLQQATRTERNDRQSAALCPQARQDESIVAQAVLDEFVVYDLQRHKAHQLNPTAAAVWQWCDGQTPPEAMVERLATRYGLPASQAEPLLWLTLEKLAQGKLLTDKVTAPTHMQGISRRQMLRVLAIASLLPVVYTIAAPQAVYALSVGCGPYGATSGTCYKNATCDGSSPGQIIGTLTCTQCAAHSQSDSWKGGTSGCRLV